MNNFCKECGDKKHKIGTKIDLEVEDFSGTNNNVEISNEKHGMSHDNFDERRLEIANEIHGVLHERFNEGSATIDNERHGAL